MKIRQMKMKRSDNIENDMVGKTVKRAYVDGYEVYIIFTDGSIFSYGASDAGYSSYSLELKDEEQI